MTNVKFRRAFLNPSNIKRLSGITRKIIKVIQRGDEIEVVFAGEPTVGQIQAVLQMLNQGYWEVVEE